MKTNKGGKNWEKYKQDRGEMEKKEGVQRGRGRGKRPVIRIKRCTEGSKNGYLEIRAGEKKQKIKYWGEIEWKRKIWGVQGQLILKCQIARSGATI